MKTPGISGKCCRNAEISGDDFVWGKPFTRRADVGKAGGYENIYRDLLDDLKSEDLAQAAKVLNLAHNFSQF